MKELDELLKYAIDKNESKIKDFLSSKRGYKVGIMGGTFNPIHNAHLVIAEFIRDKYCLDKIIFIPTGNPPHKSHVVDKQHRFDMVVLATRKNDDFFVLDYEMRQTHMTYTVNTLKYLRSIYDFEDLYFITGSDTINQIETWKDFRENFALAKFIAAARPGINLLETQENIVRYRREYGASIDMLYVPALEISSTYIRSRLKSNHTIKYLMPTRVEEYIYDRGIYGGAID